MKIESNQIQQIIEKILKDEKRRGVESFYISWDYYWNVVKEERYDPYREPSDFTMGQLTWDWENLVKTLNGVREPTRQHLVWLGQILIAIGESSIKSSEKSNTE